jgi:hypothetical protein
LFSFSFAFEKKHRVRVRRQGGTGCHKLIGPVHCRVQMLVLAPPPQAGLKSGTMPQAANKGVRRKWVLKQFMLRLDNSRSLIFHEDYRTLQPVGELPKGGIMSGIPDH